ncbi:hypothetical protein N7445_001660 [Penicillium cf. griseofulvum]|nr:hypothetical protein N7445_001660 [Penicillium cf. griseofulvum]
MQYLDNLPTDSDDDLVLIVDSYDVVFQLPADVLIQRYFDVIEAANARIAAQFGQDSVDSLSGENSPRQTILFGSDKVCWPDIEGRPACWAVPEDVGIPVGAFGPVDGGMDGNMPRWLNSGTIIGPVGNMREFFAATLERIEATYNAQNKFGESDQMYMADIWGEQEFWRSVDIHNHNFHDDVDPNTLAPDGKPDLIIPTKVPGQKTEFHIGMDYESGLFQTRAGNDRFVQYIAFNQTTSDGTASALITQNVVESSNFVPYHIDMPANVISSLVPRLSAISDVLEADPKDIITDIRLGTNLVTKTIYGLFHCAGDKSPLNHLWYQQWFQRYARPLLEAGARSIKEKKEISNVLIDGRKWVVAHSFPITSRKGVYVAGAWADLDDQWLTWKELCLPFKDQLFGAE